MHGPRAYILDDTGHGSGVDESETGEQPVGWRVLDEARRAGRLGAAAGWSSLSVGVTWFLCAAHYTHAYQGDSPPGKFKLTSVNQLHRHGTFAKITQIVGIPDGGIQVRLRCALALQLRPRATAVVCMVGGGIRQA